MKQHAWICRLNPTQEEALSLRSGSISGYLAQFGSRARDVTKWPSQHIDTISPCPLPLIAFAVIFVPGFAKRYACLLFLVAAIQFGSTPLTTAGRKLSTLSLLTILSLVISV
jgi:hypothetical protein